MFVTYLLTLSRNHLLNIICTWVSNAIVLPACLGSSINFNTFGKETLSMTRTIMKAVGAVAAGRNRKVHMKTVGVTIYCDEGSMGSNPALPQKEAVSF